MIFVWNSRNVEHIAKHDVTREEAEEIVRRAKPPFPRVKSDDKRLVWGVTDVGRFLQVVYVKRRPEEIDYSELPRYAIMSMTPVLQLFQIIHARDLTKAEQRKWRRLRR